MQLVNMCMHIRLDTIATYSHLFVEPGLLVSVVQAVNMPVKLQIRWASRPS